MRRDRLIRPTGTGRKGVVEMKFTAIFCGLELALLLGTPAAANSMDGSHAVRSNVIGGAFNGASGVAVVQQNNGHNNAFSAAVAVSGYGGLSSLALIP